MNKTEKLNQLFIEWKSTHSDLNNAFSHDGIIDESKYERAQKKILVITKESNNPEQSEEDYRFWWKDGLKYNFSHRIAEWSFGILKSFPTLESMTEADCLESIQQIAFMNLKKLAGGSSVNEEEFKQYIKRDRDFIVRQIAIIEPEIIVSGIGYDDYWKIIYPDIELKPSGYDITIAKYDNMKIVSYYHPSYRVPKAMLYALLKEVCQSESFMNL